MMGHSSAFRSDTPVRAVSLSGPVAGLLAGIGAALLPWWMGVADMRLCVEFLVLVAIAQMWNLLGGYAGIVVVGPQVFIGVGAYSLFWASNHFALNPFAALPFAALGAGLTAAIFAPLLFRLRGPYFAIGTWVLAEIFRIGITNADFLGAGAGMSLDTLGTMDRWTRNAAAYWSALGIVATVIVALVMLFRSALGAGLTALKDDEEAAASLGVNVELFKRVLFIVAAAVIGLAGSVYYINVIHIGPDAAFSMNWAAWIIFVVIIGGLGSIAGPVLGCFLFFLLRETLSDVGAWYLIGLGLLAILVMLTAPDGLWRVVRRAVDPLKTVIGKALARLG